MAKQIALLMSLLYTPERLFSPQILYILIFFKNSGYSVKKNTSVWITKKNEGCSDPGQSGLLLRKLYRKICAIDHKRALKHMKMSTRIMFHQQAAIWRL